MKTFLLIALSLCVAAGASADVKIVQRVKSGPVMGQPPKDTTMTMAIKGKQARVDAEAGKAYQIIDLDSGKVFVVDPDKKQVMVMTTAMLKQTMSMMGQITGQKTKPEVKKTGATHTYNGYKCEDVVVTMTGLMAFTSTSCVSSSIDISEFEAFKEFGQDFSRAFGVDATGGIPGFPVHSETKINMMGQNIDSTTDLVSITHDSLSDSLFAIPPDYKQQEMKMPAAPEKE
jgi:hypothetical protein